ADARRHRREHLVLLRRADARGGRGEVDRPHPPRRLPRRPPLRPLPGGPRHRAEHPLRPAREARRARDPRAPPVPGPPRALRVPPHGAGDRPPSRRPVAHGLGRQARRAGRAARDARARVRRHDGARAALPVLRRRGPRPQRASRAGPRPAARRGL
ncbi:MAG: Transcriptional regulator, HxlR family, partial [uncultured Solirubrobacteraceae bacterium]